MVGVVKYFLGASMSCSSLMRWVRLVEIAELISGSCFPFFILCIPFSLSRYSAHLLSSILIIQVLHLSLLAYNVVNNMFRFFSLIKHSFFLTTLVANRSVSAKTPNENKPTTTGWMKEQLDDPYIAASTPGRIVSVSRRSITFYDQNNKDLDYGLLIGSSFVKKRPIEENKKGHHNEK